jgi:RES domain-containing protein
VVAAADVPDDVSCVNVRSGSLPATWRQTPAPVELAAIGDRFARRRREAILVVPSALAPDESNWLLNPDHPDFRRVRIHPPEPFAYDARFFA